MAFPRRGSSRKRGVLQMSGRAGGFTFIEMLAALLISSSISMALFECVLSFEQLHQRQTAMLVLASKKRTLMIVLREKIHSAGDFSCEAGEVSPAEFFHIYTEASAFSDLGISIKPHTHLLQLKECVSIDGEMHYLPLNFFIPKENPLGLFIKIADHPSEEWIRGVTDFRVASTDLIRVFYTVIAEEEAKFAQTGEIDVAPRRSAL